MTQYLLVPACHQFSSVGDDRLMAPESQQLFKQKVESLITNTSLVLCEGFQNAELVDRTHPKYHLLHDRHVVLPEHVQPIFGGFDFRQQNKKTLSDYDAEMARYDLWDDFVKEHLRTDPGQQPCSLAEVIEIAKTPPTTRFDRTLTADEIALARWVRFNFRKFDRLYLEAMHRIGRRFKLCFFIGGAAHVVAMALKSGYPVAETVPGEELLDVLDSYLASYYWTTLALQN